MIKVSELQSKLGKANVDDVVKVNQLIEWLHRKELAVKFQEELGVMKMMKEAAEYMHSSLCLDH